MGCIAQATWKLERFDLSISSIVFLSAEGFCCIQGRF